MGAYSLEVVRCLQTMCAEVVGSLLIWVLIHSVLPTAIATSAPTEAPTLTPTAAASEEGTNTKTLIIIGVGGGIACLVVMKDVVTYIFAQRALPVSRQDRLSSASELVQTRLSIGEGREASLDKVGGTGEKNKLFSRQYSETLSLDNRLKGTV